jgi:SAM-dependent methyltransferase
VDNIKQQWEQRQKELGNTTRAVLFKNFPAFFNERVNRQHVHFLLKNLPSHVRSMLDVGCGYGRTAAAIKRQHPGIEINGIELCEEFARAFAENIGPCFHGSAGDFHTERQYDAITIVTLLMYLDRGQQKEVLKKLWLNLRPGGRLILIEPSVNILTLLRRKFRVQTLAPTGGEVCYFQTHAFEGLLASAIPDGSLIKTSSFNMPLTGFPKLHIGAVLEKSGTLPY